MIEGIDYINAYSKSTLKVGRMLSNFYHCPIATPEGVFQSVEAYYYYLGLPDIPEKEELKYYYGYMAKERGQKLQQQFGKFRIDETEFHTKILQACIEKIKHNIYLLEPKYEGLPIVHFYDYSGNIIVPANCEWWVTGLNYIVETIYNKMDT